MSNISSADTKRLEELLNEELKLYELIRDLTEKQTDFLANDEIEAFDDSLNERATLIEKIKGLHQESNPLMQSYVSLASDKKNKENTIEELKDRIRDALEICNELNKKNTETMEQKLQDHSVKIDEQSAKRKGIGGYAQSVPNTPEMFDKKT